MKTGKAYGFFNCRASREEIEAELPAFRDLAQTPSELELSLTEGMDELKRVSDLIPIVKKAEKAGMRYAMEATYPNATNKKTADELSAILNQAYQALYEKGEEFRGEIAYKEKGEYVFRK